MTETARTPSGSEVIQRLKDHESILAELYQQYALCFPEMADFWNQLVVEEKAHAYILEKLQARLGWSHIHINAGKFNIAALQTSIQSAQRRIQEAATPGFSPIRALASALDFENAIIEKEFFKVFSSDDLSLKTDFEELAHHTREHIARLRALLANLREKEQDT